jgi:ATP-binding cassette, subfamily B, bacterial
MRHAPEADLQVFAWPLSRLNEALEVVASRNGLLEERFDGAPPASSPQGDPETLARWVDAVAAQLGIEVEPAEVTYAELGASLNRAAPALIEISGAGASHFLALVRSERKFLHVLGPDLVEHAVSPETVKTALCSALEDPLESDAERLLSIANTAARQRARASQAIVQEHLASKRIGGIWLLRATPGAPFAQQIRRAGLLKPLGVVALAHALRYLLWLLSWWVIGRGALAGRLDPGWLIAWTLLLASMIPFDALTTWSQGMFSIGLAALLKQRLLYGALCLEPEEIRHQGAGQLMSRVLESEAVESLALSAGFVGLAALVELAAALAVLAIDAKGRIDALLLLGWITVSLTLGRHYWKRRLPWTEARLKITHNMIERMVGHRTRLAQQLPKRWHEGEDESLERYLEIAWTMDRDGALVIALVPRGWLLVGLLGLAPGFVSGSATTAELAVALGGMLLAYQAFQKLAKSLWHIAGAASAWTQAAPLFNAAARRPRVGSPALALPMGESNQSSSPAPMLEAYDIAFSYSGRGEPALQQANLAICRGERILISGPSGSGKSTLMALLAGLRLPESGLILLNGLDHDTLGSQAWRRRVAAAPQFHENRVLTGTFAFNLLMGRSWPPTPEDLAEAEVICRELGLGDLLDAMPAGLLQIVGETGWRLSHGECSRLYIARTLLQGADVVILDESFGALDPKSQTRALECVLKRAPALIVIAHP